MSENTQCDCLILGAGPAGMQLGYFMQKLGLDYRIVEAAPNPGSFYEAFPRHRKLISVSKVYTGYEKDDETRLRYDWNTLLCDDIGELCVSNYTREYFPQADDYVAYLRDYAKHCDLNILFNTRITSLSKNTFFELRDQQGNTYRSRYVVVATGTWLPYLPDIDGIELTEHYIDFPVDPEDYADQRVLILGKGNSAFETADVLTGTAQVIHICSPHSIKMAWKTHFFGDLRAVNNNFLDTYILKGQNSVLDADVEKIERVDGEYRAHLKFPRAKGQKGILAYDRVLACTGFRFDDSIFDESCKPEMAIRNKLPAMTSEWESVSQEGLYFAGTIMQMRDFHETTSNVIHGFRFNIRALSQILADKYHGIDLQCDEIDKSPGALAAELIERISKATAIFLQPGFLCDVVVVEQASDKARYYTGLPVDYVQNGALGEGGHYYVVTMEYGVIEGDPFSVTRDPDPSKSYLDVYLHPVVRCYCRGDLISDYHMPEHLENDWRDGMSPGENELILSWEYIGESEPEAYKKVYHRDLLQYLEHNLA
jgi:thioredoxin reductase